MIRLIVNLIRLVHIFLFVLFFFRIFFVYSFFTFLLSSRSLLFLVLLFCCFFRCHDVEIYSQFKFVRSFVRSFVWSFTCHSAPLDCPPFLIFSLCLYLSELFLQCLFRHECTSLLLCITSKCFHFTFCFIFHCIHLILPRRRRRRC